MAKRKSYRYESFRHNHPRTQFQIIRNTYRTLMTRAQKGCLIFCTDPELQAYFKMRLQKAEKYGEVQPWLTKVAEESEGY